MDLAPLITIALAAGAEVKRIYEGGSFRTIWKLDGSPVTEADHRAERIILDGLRWLDKSVPVIAEEEVCAGRMPETAEAFYLVDPLDGTREFVNRNGDFTVNIGLIRNGVPVAGVVYAPALGDVYAGTAGEAFHAGVVNGRLGPTSPIRVRPAPDRLSIVTSRSRGSEAQDRWIERHAPTDCQGRGSSLKFCLIAAGAADAYPRFGRTMEWDTAAGDAILRAAGGCVTTSDGKPLLYNKRGDGGEEAFANPSFIAYGDASLEGVW